MNVVKDLQSLIQLLHVRKEVIIFPMGVAGQQLLDLLRYANFLKKVCCVAAAQVEGGFAQKFNHELPIIPFKHLLHFRETAVIIVATAERFHAQIDAELARIGFKEVVFVRNETHVQVINELQKLYSTGQVMMWYMQHFDKKITEMEYRIAEQNEVTAVNTKAFSEYRNAFRGKDVVIVGNGPTLNYYKPIPNAIHIGLNRAWMKEDISLDYLFMIDGLGHKRLKINLEEGFSKVRYKIFRGKYVERISYNWLNFSEDVIFKNKNVVNFLFNDNNLGQLLYQDICNYLVSEFGGVASVALRFSLFTYPRKIYLAGCDTASQKHFFDENVTKKDFEKLFPNSANVKVGYARMKMFAMQYYPETEIISINPVGLRGLFKDVYTEEYKAALEAEENGVLDEQNQN